MSTAERAGSRQPDPQDTAALPDSYDDSAPAPRERITVLRSTVKIGQRQITLRRLDPWTILKLSVVFYTVLLLMVMLLLTLFWAFLNTVGAVGWVVDFASEAQLEIRYDASQIGRAIFLLGLLGVVAASGINVFFCFLYNLVADLTGGLRLTIDDQR